MNENNSNRPAPRNATAGGGHGGVDALGGVDPKRRRRNNSNRNRRRNGSRGRGGNGGGDDVTDTKPKEQHENVLKPSAAAGGGVVKKSVVDAASFSGATTVAASTGGGGDGDGKKKSRSRNRRGRRGNKGGGGNGVREPQQQSADEPMDVEMDVDVPHAPPPPQDANTTAASTNGAKAPPATEEDDDLPSFMTSHRFVDQPPHILHPLTCRALTETMKLDRLTEIQHKSLLATTSPSSNKGGGEGMGIDVLGRARTGTGKTVAFLIPALQTVLTSPPPSQGIQILILSPTRELATQIYNQAKLMLTHHTNMSTQIVMGGTNIRTDVNKFQKRLPTILVATPGRLKDHLQNTKLQHRGNREEPFAMYASKLQVLILDEADQLLEMGFRPDIFTILKFLPDPRQRQTLLFSATVPQELKEIMGMAMKPKYEIVDCIHDHDDVGENGGKNKETNAQVSQSHVILPSGMDRLVIGVLEVLLLAAMGGGDDDTTDNDGHYKIICFFSTARLTGYFADLFNHGILPHYHRNSNKRTVKLPSHVYEIHSRKSQSHRTKSSDQFRTTKQQCSILFTSDVSARGVDYPNVTHVIQFGLPESREQYIHRLGRTGRAGKVGKGWLVLAEYERKFLNELSRPSSKGGGSGVEVPPDAQLEKLFASPPSSLARDLLLPILQNEISNGSNVALIKSAELAYQSWLGFYNSNTKRMTGRIGKEELVGMANEFALLCGLNEPPALLKKTVGKMGLKGVPGLRITTDERRGS